MNAPHSRRRATAGDACGYQPGQYRPRTSPLIGLGADKINRLCLLAEARDALNLSKARRLLTEQGTCRQIGTHLWYPTGRSYLHGIRDICRDCPVRRTCLLYALATNQSCGMWAGTTAQQRQRITQRLRAAVNHAGEARHDDR